MEVIRQILLKEDSSIKAFVIIKIIELIIIMYIILSETLVDGIIGKYYGVMIALVKLNGRLPSKKETLLNLITVN